MVQQIHYLQKYWTNGSTNTFPSEILSKWFNQYIIFINTEQMVQPIHYLQKYWTNGSTNTLSSGTPNICISLKWSKCMTHHWHMYSVWWLNTGWGLWCLTPLSTKFELYRAGLLYSRRNQGICNQVKDKFYPIIFYRVHLFMSGIQTHNR